MAEEVVAEVKEENIEEKKTKKKPKKKEKEEKNYTNGLGIASLIIGISSILFLWVPFLGLLLGIIGIICSSKQTRKFPNRIATAGYITSLIGLIFSALFLMFSLIFGTLFMTILAPYAKSFLF